MRGNFMLSAKRFLSLMPACAIALWLSAGAAPAQAHSGHDHGSGLNITLPDVLAQVNGKDIRKDTIMPTLVKNVERYKERGMELTPQQQKVAAKKLLDEEINRNLLLAKAEKLGVSVSDQELDARVKEIKSSFKNEQVFQQQLKMRNLTLDQYKTKLRDDLLMDKVLEKELAGRIQVPENRIKTYFENNKDKLSKPAQRKASVILIKVDPKSGSAGEMQAREKLEEILSQLKEGKSFAEMARQYSEDSLASRGGDLGWFTADSHMYAPFRERAFQLKQGEVSDIFRTKHGLQILKVTDAQEGRKATLENSRNTVRKKLVEQELKKQTRPYLESLKKEANVKVYF